MHRPLAPGLVLLVGLLACFMADPASAQTLYDGDAFSVTDSSVVQGNYRAVAHSPTRLTSTYPRERTAVNFKFALNRQDNERLSGDDRRIRLNPVGGRFLTPVYTFGGRQPSGFPQPGSILPRADADSFDVVFRVDLRPVLRSFRQTGSYTPPHGAPISEEDFDGVYVMGDTAPLSWDRDVWASDRFRFSDADGDGVYSLTLSFARRDLRPLDDQGRAVWTLPDSTAETVSDYPQYSSDQVLVDALYNLSLEESRLDVRDDGAFMAGKKWPGVWTRDISYSILLSLALADPDGAKASLLHKVTPDGRIRQDTGTGGSWPISTDRMTWSLAAWEVYLTTGDRDWLERVYPIIERSVAADQHAAVDDSTGLVRGESSFMDWREQSYPDWMDPKDIYLSQTLSTNVVHFRTYEILAAMADELGRPSEPWTEQAETIRDAVNEHLWMDDEGLYSEYRYGRNHLSTVPRYEGLGASLAILTGLAGEERAQTLAARQPVVDYGTPSFWPYIPEIPPYHNAGIWPFVSSYWTWASAEAKNTPGVEHGLAGIYRAAALFLTNKENMVAQTGHFEGTQINSDRQLWSVAGTLSTVYRVFFGMRFRPDGLHLRPFVPEGYTGTRTLTGVRYRDAVLDLTIRGHGHSIVQITLDDEPLQEPIIPADLSGRHEVRIVLNGGLPDATMNRVANRYTPSTPQVRVQNGDLRWAPVDGADHYRIVRNGAVHDSTNGTRFRLPVAQQTLDEYQVLAVGPDGLTSFLSEPVRHVAAGGVRTVQPDGSLQTTSGGFTGDGYRVLTTDDTTQVTVEVTVDAPGTYAVDARYANGSGPINTDNKAALRTLTVNDSRAGVVVMPQRGVDAWDDWGYSNPVAVPLDAGTHTLTLVYTDLDANMNDENVNTAYLDHLRLTRVKDR